MKALHSSGASVNFYQTTRRHMWEDIFIAVKTWALTFSTYILWKY